MRPSTCADVHLVCYPAQGNSEGAWRLNTATGRVHERQNPYRNEPPWRSAAGLTGAGISDTPTLGGMCPTPLGE